MNNKAQFEPFYLLMIGIILFILGFALASPMISNSTNVRDGLDCSNASISTDNKITCTVVDLIAPTVIGLIFGFGGIVLFAKFTL